MNAIEVSAKTVDDAVTQALIQLETTSDKMEYEVVDKGNTGFLGIGRKPAIIKAWIKKEEIIVANTPEEFLKQICQAMGLDVVVDAKMNEEDKVLDINLVGEDMGILIGKRGQTLDSLQYLTGLIVNKNEEDYIRVKLDTENYRQRRKETLENLAKNIAFKVKKTKRPVSLEPMNPYERRVIHSALQNDKFVLTRSEGEDPYRHVVISLKREKTYTSRSGNNRNGYGRYNSNYRSSNNSYHNKFRQDRKEFNHDFRKKTDNEERIDTKTIQTTEEQ